MVNGFPGIALGTVAGMAGIGAYNVYNKSQSAPSEPKSSQSAPSASVDEKSKPTSAMSTVFQDVADRTRKQQLEFTKKLTVEKKAAAEKENASAENRSAEQSSHSPWLFNNKWSSKTAPLLAVDDHMHDGDGKCPWVDDGTKGAPCRTKSGGSCTLCRPPPAVKRNPACKCACHWKL